MSVTVLVASTVSNLTTLAQVEQELGITFGADDDVDNVLLGMIARASSAIEAECGRRFACETVYETLKGTNSQLLGLERAPLVTVTQVLEDSEIITDYSIEDAAAGALYRESGWRRAFGASGFGGGWGTEAYASGYILPGGQATQRYIVTYRAGYTLPDLIDPFVPLGPTDPTVLPGLIEQACLETVKTWWAQSDGVVADANAVTIGSMRVQYAGATVSDAAARLGLPSQVIGMLRQYRRVF